MSWQPFNFMTPIAASANVASTNFFMAPVSGYFAVSVMLSTIAASALITATVTISYTEMGVSKQQTVQLALALLANAVSDYKSIYADAGTWVTYSVSGLSAGSIRLHLGWKPQGS